jgi:hypothetical protein
LNKKDNKQNSEFGVFQKKFYFIQNSISIEFSLVYIILLLWDLEKKTFFSITLDNKWYPKKTGNCKEYGHYRLICFH